MQSIQIKGLYIEKAQLPLSYLFLPLAQGHENGKELALVDSGTRLVKENKKTKQQQSNSTFHSLILHRSCNSDCQKSHDQFMLLKQGTGSRCWKMLPLFYPTGPVVLSLVKIIRRNQMLAKALSAGFQIKVNFPK